MLRCWESESYLDPISGVLKNRFGIIDTSLLEMAEADLVAIRSCELALTLLKGRFDLNHFQPIHRFLLCDIYEWAGMLRTVDIPNNSRHFAPHAYPITAAQPIFATLAADNFWRDLKLNYLSLVWRIS
jgi:cell filamentation protein